MIASQSCPIQVHIYVFKGKKENNPTNKSRVERLPRDYHDW